jgi:hypothetical protein
LSKYGKQFELNGVGKLVKINAQAKLVEGFQIVLDDGYSHAIVVDLPPDLGTGM